MQPRIYFEIAYFVVRLTVRVAEKIFERGKCNESVYRSSVDVGLLFMFKFSLPGVDDVLVGWGAFDGPASSVKLTFKGVAWRMLNRVFSSALIIIETD